MKLFRASILVFIASLVIPVDGSATTVIIDDSKDKLTVSINGVTVTSANQSIGNCVGGCQNVTGFLIEPGSAANPQSASVDFDDFTIASPNLPQGTLFFSKVLALTEAGGTPGVPHPRSDAITVTVRNVGVATQISVLLNSDFGENGLGPCGANCVNLGDETGDFLDITTAALGSMQPAALALSDVPGLSVLVRSDVAEVPVPAAFVLFASGLLGVAGRAAWRRGRHYA